MGARRHEGMRQNLDLRKLISQPLRAVARGRRLQQRDGKRYGRLWEAMQTAQKADGMGAQQKVCLVKNCMRQGKEEEKAQAEETVEVRQREMEMQMMRDCRGSQSHVPRPRSKVQGPCRGPLGTYFDGSGPGQASAADDWSQTDEPDSVMKAAGQWHQTGSDNTPARQTDARQTPDSKLQTSPPTV